MPIIHTRTMRITDTISIMCITGTTRTIITIIVTTTIRIIIMGIMPIIIISTIKE